MKTKEVFALTGNICCGKSVVAGFLAKYPKVTIIDTDTVAKKIIDSGSCNKEIEEIFGYGVFLKEEVGYVYKANTPNRRLMARKMFCGNNAEKIKRDFEKVIHPLVWDAVQKQVAVFNSRELVIVESAIIYETGRDKEFNGVIVATCSEQEQNRRIHQRSDCFMRKVVKACAASQLSLSEKVKRADFVIDTDCTQEELWERTRNLFVRLFINNK